jgi:hypothetical protein
VAELFVVVDFLLGLLQLFLCLAEHFFEGGCFPCVGVLGEVDVAKATLCVCVCMCVYVCVCVDY